MGVDSETWAPYIEVGEFGWARNDKGEGGMYLCYVPLHAIRHHPSFPKRTYPKSISHRLTYKSYGNVTDSSIDQRLDASPHRTPSHSSSHNATSSAAKPPCFPPILSAPRRAPQPSRHGWDGRSQLSATRSAQQRGSASPYTAAEAHC
jgi:hypothetical protein